MAYVGQLISFLARKQLIAQHASLCTQQRLQSFFALVSSIWLCDAFYFSFSVFFLFCFGFCLVSEWIIIQLYRQRLFYNWRRKSNIDDSGSPLPGWSSKILLNMIPFGIVANAITHFVAKPLSILKPNRTILVCFVGISWFVFWRQYDQVSMIS